jgi:outer membrane protein assembly factor BamB
MDFFGLTAMAILIGGIIPSGLHVAGLGLRVALHTARLQARQPSLAGSPEVVLADGRLVAISRNSSAIEWSVGSARSPVIGFIHSGDSLIVGTHGGKLGDSLWGIDKVGMRRLCGPLPGPVTPLKVSGNLIVAAYEDLLRDDGMHAGRLFAYDKRKRAYAWRRSVSNAYEAGTVFPRAIPYAGIPMPTIQPTVAPDGSAAPASIVFRGNRIYTADQVGFSVYTLRTGKMIWHEAGIGPSLRHSYASPYPFVMVSPARAVIGSGMEQVLACLRLSTASRPDDNHFAWQKSLGQPIRSLALCGRSVVAVTGGIVAFGGFEHDYDPTTHVRAFDPVTGRELWSHPFAGPGGDRPGPPCMPTGGVWSVGGKVVAAGINIYPGDLGHYVSYRFHMDYQKFSFVVEALDARTGGRSWTLPTNGHEDIAAVVSGVLVLDTIRPGESPSRVTAVDLATGRLLWRRAGYRYLRVLGPGRLLLERTDGSFLALTARSGTPLRTYPTLPESD